MDKDYLIIVRDDLDEVMLDVREISHIRFSHVRTSRGFVKAYVISMKNGEQIQTRDDILQKIEDQQENLKNE